MKPIGYYAGFLSQKEQDEITNASPWQLCDLLSDTSIGLYKDVDSHYNEDPSLNIEFDTMTNLCQIALIRGLCDRIEQKLMEVAE